MKIKYIYIILIIIYILVSILTLIYNNKYSKIFKIFQNKTYSIKTIEQYISNESKSELNSKLNSELEQQYIPIRQYMKKDKSFYRNLFDMMNVFSSDKYDKSGYNSNGFDRSGYNRNGFNKYGYDISGFNKEHYDTTGFNINGIDRDGYDKFGFKDGYDRNGFDKNGYKIDGFDKNGYNEFGYDKNGLNIYGFDKNGVNQKLRENAYQRTDSYGSMFEGNAVGTPLDRKFAEDINRVLAEDDKRENVARQQLDKYNKGYANKQCYIHTINGVKTLPPEYKKYGCNLYKYYNQCTECVNKGDDYCLIYEDSKCPDKYTLDECDKLGLWSESGVNCVKDGQVIDSNKFGNKKYTCPTDFKCINPPFSTPGNPGGFGCYNKYYTKMNSDEENNTIKHNFLAPINPNIKERRVCEYPSDIDLDINNGDRIQIIYRFNSTTNIESNTTIITKINNNINTIITSINSLPTNISIINYRINIINNTILNIEGNLNKTQHIVIKKSTYMNILNSNKYFKSTFTINDIIFSDLKIFL